MMEFPNLQMFEAGSLQWLEARTKNITATEVSSLFGLNKYKSPRRLLQDKLHPEPVWSPFIRRGRILEPSVLKAVKEDLGWRVSPFLTVAPIRDAFNTIINSGLELTDHDVRRILSKADDNIYFYSCGTVRLSATPDSVRLDSDFEVDALIELKSATEVRLDDWDVQVPFNYLLQVHVQMLCTGVDKAYVAGLGAFDPFPLIVYEVIWNDRIIQLIVTEVHRWWECYELGKDFVVNNRNKLEMIKLLTNNVRRIY